MLFRSPAAEKRLAELGERYTEEKGKDVAPESSVCPTCHREYEADKKESILADFQTEKQRVLHQINLMGKGVADSLKSDKEELENCKKQLFENELKLKELSKSKADLENELETVPKAADLFTFTAYEFTKTKIETAEENLEKAQLSIKDADAKKQIITDKKRSIQSEIDAVNRILAGKQAVANAKARVEELTEEQRRLSQAIATIEKEVYLLEEFSKAKVNLLSDRINAHFKVVKWRLFERQINGGYNPVCEPMVNGQAYSSALNSGHKILAELDIIQALQRIYDISVPVFLDNAERINDFNIPEMDCQLITLNVSDDRELKVVKNE